MTIPWCGKMKEPKDNIEEDIFSMGSQRENNISVPICFLVKEQAKSSVAIQELQKRLDAVETNQEDVIDAIIHIRDYLSNSLLVANSPSFQKESPPCDDVKKDSVVSEKQQDSGLDSAGAGAEHLSITKNALKPESSDELIQLLDEIACRSGMLMQRHLAAVDENDYSDAKTVVEETSTKESCLSGSLRVGAFSNDLGNLCEERTSGSNTEIATSTTRRDLFDTKPKIISSKDLSSSTPLRVTVSSAFVPESTADLFENKPFGYKTDSSSGNPLDATVPSAFVRGNVTASRAYVSEDVTASRPFVHENASAFVSNGVPTRRHDVSMVDVFENKPIGYKSMSSSKRRSTSSIDGTAVSSILKETNVKELQRLALIYLADNAVLHSKVHEADQIASLKQLESERLEMSLKDEGRLLMMENRELRIAADEAKLEANTLRCRIGMLERMLCTVSQENQELNVHLGESFNVSTSRKGLLNSSYAFEGASHPKTNPRRSSLPAKLCEKSNRHNSNFMDLTVEESDEIELEENSAFAKSRKMFAASTPLLPMQKTRKPSPTSFQSVKKCFKGSHISDIRNTSDVRTFSDVRINPDSDSTCAKQLNFQNSETTFPFNTILDKLRNNSEYRVLNRAGGNSVPVDATGGRNSSKSAENASETSAEKRKTRNIQQRIQNILDRIVAESEDTS